MGCYLTDMHSEKKLKSTENQLRHLAMAKTLFSRSLRHKSKKVNAIALKTGRSMSFLLACLESGSSKKLIYKRNTGNSKAKPHGLMSMTRYQI